MTASGRALATAAPLDARDIPKYVAPLWIPGHAGGGDRPGAGRVRDRGATVPSADPAAVVAAHHRVGYGSTAHPGSFGYPAPTIMARVGRPVR
ncbi:hypothetical protein NKG94_19625 [Micromonospora sp. M12]